MWLKHVEVAAMTPVVVCFSTAAAPGEHVQTAKHLEDMFTANKCTHSPGPTQAHNNQDVFNDGSTPLHHPL